MAFILEQLVPLWRSIDEYRARFTLKDSELL